MKRFKGKWFAGIILLLACGCLAGCKKTDDVSSQGSQKVVSSAEGTIAMDGESEILLVERSTNYAWGHHDHGLFVDAQGKVYAFDFSRYPSYMPHSDTALTFVERLELIRENSEELVIFDEEFIREVMGLGESLSPEDEFDEKEKMYDYGQSTLYFYQPKSQELLQVKSTGDVDYTPKNKNAKKIAKLYEKYIERYAKPIAELSYGRGIPTVYSSDDVIMMNFSANDAGEWVGKWVLETKAQLKAFAEQSGIPVDVLLVDDDDAEYDESTYFISVEALGQKENCGNPRAFWIQGSCMDFLCPDGTNTEEGAFVCHLTVVRKEDLFGVGDDLFDLNGTAWKKF